MSTTNTSATNPGGFSANWAVNVQDEEIKYNYRKYLRDVMKMTSATSAYMDNITFYGPTTVWDQRSNITGGTPGGSASWDLERSSDGVLSLSLVANVPMVVDANTTGYLKTVSTDATSFFLKGDTTAAIPTLTYTAGTGGIDGVAKLTMKPSQTGSVIVPSGAVAIDSLALLNFAGGGNILYRLPAGTGGAATLVAYSGTLTGAITGSAFSSTITADDNFDVTVASSYIAFDADWSVTTAGARIASTGATTTLTNGTGWYITAANTTALSATNGTTAYATEDGLNVHNAYYVNGLCASALQSFTFTQGGLSLVQLNTKAGAAMRRRELASLDAEKQNTGMLSNFGKMAQLKLWAHRVAYSDDTSIPKQLFAYKLPLAKDVFADAIWLAPQSDSTPGIRMDFTPLEYLVTSSTVPLTHTSSSNYLPNTRKANHADSGVQITATDIAFSMQTMYYIASKGERQYFLNVKTIRTITSMSPVQTFVPGTNLQYTPNKLATMMICAAQMDDTKRPITNGKFDQHNYKTALNMDAAPSEETDTNLHVPVLQEVEEQYNSSKRATLDDVTSFTYAALTSGGRDAISTGVWYIPYDIVCQQRHKRNCHTGMQPNSSTDRHIFNVTARGGRTANVSVYLHHETLLFVEIDKHIQGAFM